MSDFSSSDLSLPLNDESVLPPNNPFQEQEEYEEEEQQSLRPTTPNEPTMEQQVLPLDVPSTDAVRARRPSAASVASLSSLPSSESAAGQLGQMGQLGQYSQYGVLFGDSGATSFNPRCYVEELNKLKKENLSLRLRIYLLEKDKGLLPRAEEKENVFRVNLDLKVANESMNKELAEKTKLLRQAANMMEERETERLRERMEYESLVVSLREDLDNLTRGGNSKGEFSMAPSSVGNYSGSQQDRNPPPTIEEVEGEDEELDQLGLGAAPSVGDRSKALLFEAFGSLNLGKPGDMHARIEELTYHLEEREEQIRKLEEELVDKTTAFDRLNGDFHDKINALQVHVEDKEVAMTTMQEELDHINERLQEKEAECSRKNSDLNETSKEASELKNRIESLEDAVAEKEKLLASMEDSMARGEGCINSVSEAYQVLNGEKAALQKEVDKRDAALKVLTKEYEVLKAKIRKYRKEGMNSHCHSETSQLSQADVEATAKLSKQLNEVKERESALRAEVTRMRPLQHALEAKEDVASALEKEVALLQSELRTCKATAMKAGADKALRAASHQYSVAVNSYASEMTALVTTLRERLTELYDFLQQLINMEGEGVLNFSGVSDSFRGALQRSMEETRRFSQSMSQSLLMAGEDANETQRSMLLGGGDDLVMPTLQLPEVVLDLQAGKGPSVDEEVESKLRDFEALVMDLKDNVRERIAAQEECEGVKQTLNEVKTALREQQLRETEYENVMVDLRSRVPEEQYQAVSQELDSEREARQEAVTAVQTLEIEMTTLRTQIESTERLNEQLTQINLAQRTDASNALNDTSMNAKVRDYELLITELQTHVAEGVEAQRRTERLNQEVSQLRELIKEKKLRARSQETEAPPRPVLKKKTGPVAVSFSVENKENDECQNEVEFTSNKQMQHHSLCRQSLDGQSCDCFHRIRELEQMLAKANVLLEDANAKIRAEEETRQRVKKAVKKQLVKTKTVLRGTQEKPAIPEEN